MFRHVVIFKSEKPDVIEKICRHVMTLKEEIPGLSDVSYFENLTDSAKGYNQMATMDFEHREDFAGWKDHPYHQEAVDLLNVISDTLFFDYEY